jgi:hypothetical protein
MLTIMTQREIRFMNHKKKRQFRLRMVAVLIIMWGGVKDAKSARRR